MDKQILAIVRASGLLQDIDVLFAELMCRLAGAAAGDELFLAASLASNVTNDEKHVCLDLAAWAGKTLGSLLPELPDDAGRLRLPACGPWTEKLRATAVVGAPGEYKPLVLDHRNRLYLYRYWQYELHLAAAIQTRLAAAPQEADPSLVRSVLQKYSDGPTGLHLWQLVAAVTALTRTFCVITGGPGTGKTFTVGVILELLRSHSPGLSVCLCAPTGKATARLQEALQQGAALAPAAAPQRICTIHRLLGARQGSTALRHTRENPLPADVVIVDEASMVPLALMTKLVAAVPPHCRLILLGDRDQLASVEAGSVLGDICEAAALNRFSAAFCKTFFDLTGRQVGGHGRDAAPGLRDCAVELTHSYRFDATAGIGALSAAVNAGDGAQCRALITRAADPAIHYRELPARDELERRLEAVVQAWCEPMVAAETIAEASARCASFKILCAHRRGPYGVAGINSLIEKILHARGRLDPRRRFYPGRPVLITCNDYTLRLFNGDTGIIREGEHGEPLCFFPDPGGSFRGVVPGRLPEHETAYAITIHKSQGSEFDTVLIILPEQDSPLLTRELLYTGITRAKRQVELWAPLEVVSAAVRKRFERASGLRDRLLEKDIG